MRPKPELLSNEFWDIETWKRETLVWCAEAMQDAADRMTSLFAARAAANAVENERRFLKRVWAAIDRGDLNV